MAGNARGAVRTAARRIGVSVEEYTALRAQGLKWCHGKRPQRAESWTWHWYDCDHGGAPTASCSYCAPLPHVWLGTSIESDRYVWRADHLRRTPAAVRFLSLEPLLGPVSSLDLDGIDWVIVGGESGPNARPMHPDWVRDIRDRCVDADVPLFVKQWGAWVTEHQSPQDITLPSEGWYLLGDDGPVFYKVGKKAAGRELDGRTWDEIPEHAGTWVTTPPTDGA